jgi:hypothetical protein
MSLEDKAKEYAEAYEATGNEFWRLRQRAFKAGFKQAIKDLMERANQSPLLMHYKLKGGMTGEAITFQMETEPKQIIYLDDLEQAAEDLIKEGR